MKFLNPNIIIFLTITAFLVSAFLLLPGVLINNPIPNSKFFNDFHQFTRFNPEKSEQMFQWKTVTKVKYKNLSVFTVFTALSGNDTKDPKHFFWLRTDNNQMSSSFEEYCYLVKDSQPEWYLYNWLGFTGKHVSRSSVVLGWRKNSGKGKKIHSAELTNSDLSKFAITKTEQLALLKTHCHFLFSWIFFSNTKK